MIALLTFLAEHWLFCTIIAGLLLFFWEYLMIQLKSNPFIAVVLAFFKSPIAKKVEKTGLVVLENSLTDGLTAWHKLVDVTIEHGDSETLRKVLELAHPLKELTNGEKETQPASTTPSPTV